MPAALASHGLMHLSAGELQLASRPFSLCLSPILLKGKQQKFDRVIYNKYFLVIK